MDWALSEPIPWRQAELGHAGTVHLGGGIEEIDASERAVHRGRIPERPFVLMVQPTVADPSRAPEGKHIAWAYSHVPHGSAADVSERMEAEIERQAPGFRETVLGRAVRTAPEMEAYNANYVGGDIAGGASDWRQLAARPVWSRHPWATPNPRLFVCSSSTPPGGGVHGMGGWHAAREVLRQHG